MHQLHSDTPHILSFCYSQYWLITTMFFHVFPVAFLECIAGLVSCSLVSHIPTFRDGVARIRVRDPVLTLSLIVYPLCRLKVIKIPIWIDLSIWLNLIPSTEVFTFLLPGKGPSFFRSKHVSGNNYSKSESEMLQCPTRGKSCRSKFHPFWLRKNAHNVWFALTSAHSHSRENFFL